MATQSEVRVLVVDDSTTVLRLLVYILGQHYTLDSASDGLQALKCYTEFKPDIIILDMNMPVKSGLEVMEHVRQTVQDHDVQIIVLTAQDTKTLKAQAFAAGANDFLAKPFDREELLARVGAAARQVTLTRRLRKAYERISREIDLVAGLQKRLLPDCDPPSGEIGVDCFYRPSGRASGDYYDFFNLPGGGVRVVMADVSGHGARAAFLMAVVRTLVRVSETHYLSLAETFSLASHHLLSTIGEEPDFVTILGADISPDQSEITYINAGHCPALLLQHGQVQTLEPTASVLGFFNQKLKPVTIGVSKPAELFLYTDGWYEWRIPSGDIYGLDRFQDLARDLMLSGRFSLKNLLAALSEEGHVGPVFLDDVTALRVTVGRPVTRVFRAKSSPGRSRQLAREVVAAIAEWVSDQDVLHDLDIMLTEACANVTRHAYEGMEGDMEVRLAVKPGQTVELTIVDWGKGFEGKVSYDNPGPDSECGRGMFIIRKLSDVCRVFRSGRENVLHIIKTIREQSWKT